MCSKLLELFPTEKTLKVERKIISQIFGPKQMKEFKEIFKVFYKKKKNS